MEKEERPEASKQPANERDGLKHSPNAVESKGYIRLWRTFCDDPLYKKPRRFSQWEAWEYLYLEARGVDTPGYEFERRVIHLKRGQLAATQRSLARRWRWSRGSVENFLAKLERRGTIAVQVYGRGRRAYLVITFLKYRELNPIKEA